MPPAKKPVDDVVVVKPIPETVAPSMNVVWQALIAAIVTCVVAYFQYQTQIAIKDQHADAINNAIEVRETLFKTTKHSETALKEIQGTTEEVKVVADKIHILSNSAMGVELNMNAELSHWKAERTKDEVDIEAARIADNKVAEHEKQQAIIDKDKKK